MSRDNRVFSTIQYDDVAPKFVSEDAREKAIEFAKALGLKQDQYNKIDEIKITMEIGFSNIDFDCSGIFSAENHTIL